MLSPSWSPLTKFLPHTFTSEKVALHLSYPLTLVYQVSAGLSTSCLTEARQGSLLIHMCSQGSMLVDTVGFPLGCHLLEVLQSLP